MDDCHALQLMRCEMNIPKKHCRQIFNAVFDGKYVSTAVDESTVQHLKDGNFTAAELADRARIRARITAEATRLGIIVPNATAHSMYSPTTQSKAVRAQSWAPNKAVMTATRTGPKAHPSPLFSNPPSPATISTSHRRLVDSATAPNLLMTPRSLNSSAYDFPDNQDDALATSLGIWVPDEGTANAVAYIGDRPNLNVTPYFSYDPATGFSTIAMQTAGPERRLPGGQGTPATVCEYGGSYSSTVPNGRIDILRDGVSNSNAHAHAHAPTTSGPNNDSSSARRRFKVRQRLQKVACKFSAHFGGPDAN